MVYEETSASGGGEEVIGFWSNCELSSQVGL